MKSQYLDLYKEHALSEIKNGKRPLSVGTFLVYRLRGNAKNWISRYLHSLKHGLEKDGWKPCHSKLHGVAYSPFVK